MVNRTKPTRFKFPAKQTEGNGLGHSAEPIASTLGVKHYVEQITVLWSKQVETIIATGRLLIEAKDQLPHGEFSAMFDGNGLPFTQRTAQYLMAIAEHPILSNPTHASLLPPSWATLYALKSLPEQALKEMLENKQITCETERQEAEKLIAYVNKEGLHKYHRVAESLNVLKEFMQEWPEPKELPSEVFDEIMEGDHCVGTTNFKKVSEWIYELYAAYMSHTGGDPEEQIRLTHVINNYGKKKSRKRVRLKGSGDMTSGF